jgi:hypothetical protein
MGPDVQEARLTKKQCVLLHTCKLSKYRDFELAGDDKVGRCVQLHPCRPFGCLHVKGPAILSFSDSSVRGLGSIATACGHSSLRITDNATYKDLGSYGLLAVPNQTSG